MGTEVCKCGSFKEHHLVDWGKMMGMTTPLTTQMVEETMVLYKMQTLLYCCDCIMYEQDNLSYLENKVKEKEDKEQWVRKQ